MAEKPQRVNRYDAIDPGRWMTMPFERTTEGFLKGRAIVTSIGVFTYRQADGAISRELRLPEEVFAISSLETMKLKPVTLDHPEEKVTPDNAEALQVGTLGNNPSSDVQRRNYDGFTPWDELTDGIHVAIDMSVNRADAIDEVLNGKRSLSMGYECEIELAEAGATFMGMAYDCIQRNIRYNHCAIVDAARAGDSARIRLDSEDAAIANYFGIRLDSKDAVLVNNNPRQDGEIQAKTQEEKAMKKIRLDNGIEYDGDEGLIQAYLDQKTKADAAEKALKDRTDSQTTEKTTLEAERDTFRDRADKAEKEVKDLKEKALDPKRIDEAAKAKIDLLLAADRAGVQVNDGMTDAEIKKAVITTMFPGSATKLDGKDEVYINARFDAAVEIMDERQDGENRAVTGDNNLSTVGRVDATAARQRMIKEMYATSRGEKAGA